MEQRAHAASEQLTQEQLATILCAPHTCCHVSSGACEWVPSAGSCDASDERLGASATGMVHMVHARDRSSREGTKQCHGLLRVYGAYGVHICVPPSSASLVRRPPPPRRFVGRSLPPRSSLGQKSARDDRPDAQSNAHGAREGRRREEARMNNDESLALAVSVLVTLRCSASCKGEGLARLLAHTNARFFFFFFCAESCLASISRLTFSASLSR